MKEDKDRDERISMEIVVDCYDSDEQFSAWHCYLEDNLQLPFEGTWKITSKGKAENVTIVGLSDYDDCHAALDMLVEIEYQGEVLSEPLKEIFKIKSDDEKTIEAIGDWHYWVQSGNSFDDEYSDDYEDDESEDEDYD